MNLCIDVGNTRVKAALFDGRKLHSFAIFDAFNLPALEEWLGHRTVDATLLSSVRATSYEWEEGLRTYPGFIRFNIACRLPLQLHYDTPETLGLDRLAGVIGARSLYKKGTLLTIDCGTCITMNLLDATDTFQGGSISPGLRMRLMALHHYTGRLPQVELSLPPSLTGKNTQDSILSGAVGGALREIRAAIDEYRLSYRPLKVILTGGDAPLLAGQIKKQIFAVPYLVLCGLNEILIHNAEKP